LEGRWATLAVRAQRDKIIDYRNYVPGDDQWLLREHILLRSVEDSIMADHCRMLIPVLGSEARLELFDKLLKYELPWALEDDDGSGGASERMLSMYEQVMEMEKEKNG